MKPPQIELTPFAEYPSLKWGEIITPQQWLYKFPNNYGLSVIGGELVRPSCGSNGTDTYEVLLIKFLTDMNGKLCMRQGLYDWEQVNELGEPDKTILGYCFVNSDYIARLALKVARF